MAIPVLLIGKSGSGKSTSMRNCVNNDNWGLIKVLDKPLPFRGKMNEGVTDDYTKLMAWLKGSKAQSIVIDDAGYLITNQFMRNHSTSKGGNGAFAMYNDLADRFWNLTQFIINALPKDKIVYVIMHEEEDQFGNIKPKTIGKLLDEKVCIEGMFTIVLRCVIQEGKHLFITQCDDGAVSKSPIGMFEQLQIDNDLKEVDKAIREYYGFNNLNNESEEY